MELATRRVIWFAVTDRPDAAWVTQQARNVNWELDELGVPVRFLIHDHDHKYGGGSDLVFEAGGMAVIRTPIAAPMANSHMERQIGSTRRECLDWLLILNRRHLERVLTVWFEHYNRARPHRGLDLQTPIARSDPVLMSGQVTCDRRLGGPARVFAHANVDSCVNDSGAAPGARALAGAHRRPDLMAIPTSRMRSRPSGRICVPDTR